MTRKTMIDFATATLPVVTGCSKDGNKGCENCYAAFQAATRLKHLPHYVGLAGFDKNGNAQWTGKVRCHEDVLEEPLRTKKPQRYFVAPRGDLFHRQVPDEFLDKVFAVMALCPQHTFLIFTKRAERRLAYLTLLEQRACENDCQTTDYLLTHCIHDGWWAGIGARVPPNHPWPLPNVWQITSVWDQESANRLIPPTLETPAAVRGISIAPMLGPVDLERVLYPTLRGQLRVDVLRGGYWNKAGYSACGPSAEIGQPKGGFTNHSDMKKIDWVIVEGKSGKNARPMHPDWVRSIRDQCANSDVPFYFKQWGEWAPVNCEDHCSQCPDSPGIDTEAHGMLFRHVGRKKAGHMLDGREHLELPT